jgi:predicted enzyme related to lactoylglutathione lyase
MRARDTSAGAPCWIDLSTSDTSVARDFYAGVFGWTAGEADPEFGGYFMFNSAGAPVAGCMPVMPGAVPDVWSSYLTVEDAQKTVEAAAAAGGQVIVQPMVVGDAGTMAVVLDPGGAAIGMWQPNQFAGLGQVGAAGLPSWFELHTRSYDEAIAFYREVFGWTIEVAADQPGFRYAMLTHDGNQLAGVFDASAEEPDAPAGWSIYFWVDDADAALEKVTELGGSVIRPAEDTPYGRLATAADPTGAVFKLMAANDQMPGDGA